MKVKMTNDFKKKKNRVKDEESRRNDGGTDSDVFDFGFILA